MFTIYGAVIHGETRVAPPIETTAFVLDSLVGLFAQSVQSNCPLPRHHRDPLLKQLPPVSGQWRVDASYSRCGDTL